MARVYHRKARKDYPASGIEKGDMYYYTKIKTGPRSSRVMRSKTPFKPSQLTTSPFKSGWYAVQEAWEAGDKDAEAIRAAGEALQEIADAATESFENMPEGLQQGETGQMLENRASETENAASELEGLADELEGLEEPDDVDDEAFDPSDWAQETSTMDPEDVGEFLSEKEQEHEDRINEQQEAHDEYQTELARIVEEAEGYIGEMPE